MVGTVTNGDFRREVLEAAQPVLVDFFASWCGPCRLQGPVLDELARKGQGQFKVVKVNADEEPELAQTYGISALPTLLVFHEGEVIQRLIGLQTKEALLRALTVAA